MPRVNVFIRKADWTRWKSIKDKPYFLHDAINAKSFISESIFKDRVVDDVEPLTGKLKELDPNWKPCKHNSDPEFCKFAKPGKPCK